MGSKRAKNLRKAIHLLSHFEKDFPFKDCTTVTKGAKMSDRSKSILYNFTENVHDAKVNFHMFLHLSTLTIDES